MLICNRCLSSAIIKYGWAYTKTLGDRQIYYCHECNRTTRDPIVKSTSRGRSNQAVSLYQQDSRSKSVVPVRKSHTVEETNSSSHMQREPVGSAFVRDILKVSVGIVVAVVGLVLILGLHTLALMASFAIQVILWFVIFMLGGIVLFTTAFVIHYMYNIFHRPNSRF